MYIRSIYILNRCKWYSQNKGKVYTTLLYIHYITKIYTYTHLLLPPHPLALFVPLAYQQLYTVVHDVCAEHPLLKQLAYMYGRNVYVLLYEYICDTCLCLHVVYWMCYIYLLYRCMCSIYRVSYSTIYMYYIIACKRIQLYIPINVGIPINRILPNMRCFNFIHFTSYSNWVCARISGAKFRVAASAFHSANSVTVA